MIRVKLLILFITLSAHKCDNLICDNLNEALEYPLKVKVLKLNTCNGFNSVNDLSNISQLKKLVELEISECPKVISLPAEISELHDLKILRFYWNGGGIEMDWKKQLKIISELKELEILQLGPYNIIKELPSEIGSLSNLKVLNISKTTTYSLPKRISDLKKLEELDISMTKISSLPTEIYLLSNLKKLNLAETSIANDSIYINEIKSKLPNCEIILY